MNQRYLYKDFTAGETILVQHDEQQLALTGRLIRVLRSPTLVRFWVETKDKQVYCVASRYCSKLNTAFD